MEYTLHEKIRTCLLEVCEEEIADKLRRLTPNNTIEPEYQELVMMFDYFASISARVACSISGLTELTNFIFESKAVKRNSLINITDKFIIRLSLMRETNDDKSTSMNKLIEYLVENLSNKYDDEETVEYVLMPDQLNKALFIDSHILEKCLVNNRWLIIVLFFNLLGINSALTAKISEVN